MTDCAGFQMLKRIRERLHAQQMSTALCSPFSRPPSALLGDAATPHINTPLPECVVRRYRYLWTRISLPTESPCCSSIRTQILPQNRFCKFINLDLRPTARLRADNQFTEGHWPIAAETEMILSHSFSPAAPSLDRLGPYHDK